MVEHKRSNWRIVNYLVVTILVVGLYGGCTGSSLIRSNEFLIADGKLKQAIANYKEALKEDPKNDELLFRLAGALFKSGDFKQASHEISKAILIEPQLDSYRLLAGKISFAESNYFKATNQLLNALLLNNNNLEAYYMLALSYQAMGETDKAVAQLETAVDIEPLYFDAQTLFAEIKFQRIRKSMKAIDANEKKSSNKVASADQGNGTQEDPALEVKELIIKYRQVLSSNPKSVKGTLLLSQLYEFIGETKRSQALLNNWIDSYGNISEEIIVALADLHFKHGEFTKASGVIERLQNTSIQSDILKLKIQQKVKPNSTIEKTIEQLLKTNGDSVELLLMSAQIERQKGRLFQAENRLQTCIDKDPEFAGCYYALSSVLKDQRDVIGSQWALQKAFDISPYDVDLRLEYVENLLDNNEIDKAKTLLTHFSLDQLNPKVAFLNGRVAKAQKDFKKAADLFNHSRKHVYEVDVETEIAELEILQGKTEQAERRLNDIELTAPGHLKITLARATLFEATNRLERVPAILKKHLKTAQGAGRIHLKLANSYARTGKIREAINLLNQGLKIWRRHLELSNAYTFYLGLIGDYPRAIDILTDMQSFNHQYNQLFHHRLRMYRYKAGQINNFKAMDSHYNQYSR